MADNTVLDPGTGGDVVAMDDIAGVKYQRVKLVLGADGVNDGDVASGNAMPVTAASLTTIASAVSTHDAVATDGHGGMVMLAKRRDSDATAMVQDGDFGFISLDENQRVKVSTQPASYAVGTGNITANAQTVFLNVERASNVTISMVATTLVGHNATFEFSNNSTSGTDGNWYVVQVARTNANTAETATGVLAATPAYGWEVSVNAYKWIRIRATAHTSGTAAYTIVPGSYATEPVPIIQVTGTQPVSGTVTVTSTRITPNAADGHSSLYHLISAATTNDTLVLTGARAIGLVTATNINAAARYLKLYNKATAPTSGDTPAMTILLPPGQTTVITGNSPIRFPLGIGIRLTTGIAVADTGAVSAAEHTVSIAYT